MQSVYSQCRSRSSSQHALLTIHSCMAVDQNPMLSWGPAPLLQAFVAAGCFKPFVADFSRLRLDISPQGSALFFGGLLQRALSQNPRLLQTYVAKWPPKVTNPKFLIGCHMHAAWLQTFHQLFLLLHYPVPSSMNPWWLRYPPELPARPPNTARRP